MKQCQEIKQNWAGRRNFGIYFCVIFDHQYQILILEGKLGARLCFQPFLRFFQYLQIFCCLSTREATRIQYFLYQISCTTLFVVNRTYTKILKCFIILCPRLQLGLKLTKWVNEPITCATKQLPVSILVYLIFGQDLVRGRPGDKNCE